MTRQFDFAMPEQFPELVELVSALMTRKISDVHLHHTALPDRAFYDDLAGPHDRNGEAAGREICERLWTSHVERHGWQDIAQHVTIDPAGRIWMGRDWNLPPASAAGHNGNATRGPFMLALVGNFVAGAETPTAAQLEATAAVVAAVQRAFGLAPDALNFHCDLDGQRTCPGTLDRDALLKAVAALPKAPRGDVAARAARRQSARGLPAAHGRRDLNGGDNRGERPLGDEAPGCLPGVAPDSGLTARRTRGTAARGGGGGDEAITPEMFRMLKPHVIHLRSGRFEDDGPFATTRSDAEGLVASIVRWARGLRGDATPRVLIWAHGGLAPLDRALAYAWRYHRWWLANDIYPVFFVWETGAIETALQIVEAQLGPRPAASRGTTGSSSPWCTGSAGRSGGR